MRSKTVLAKPRKERLLKMPKRVWFLDVDGVLADNKHRLRFAKSKDYARFYDQDNMILDEKIPEFDVIESMILKSSDEVVLVTGRPMRTKELTVSWIRYNYPELYRHLNIDLSMFRKDHDYRRSHIVKFEMVKKIYDTLDPKPEEIVIVDDDIQNVMYMDKKLKDENVKVTSLVFSTERFNDYVPNT